jgi:hypothetical protein
LRASDASAWLSRTGEMQAIVDELRRQFGESEMALARAIGWKTRAQRTIEKVIAD